MLIQAYRRKSKSTHEVGGVHYEFAKNEAGHFVAEVADEDSAAVFLAITDAFKLYGGEAPSQAKPASKGTAAPGKFVITNGEKTVDLGAMNDAEVKQFADEQHLDYDGRLKGDRLREAVKAGLQAE